MTKTKREYFNELLTYVHDNDELTTFINHELALLDKKNKKSKDGALTAKQKENETLKASIYNAIVMANCPQTCADVAETFDISSQKASAMLKSLVDDGQVVRTVKKRVPYFSTAELATDYFKE